MEKLPNESDSQRIGHFAELAFYASHPLSWRTIQTDGDADAGLDFMVQEVRKKQYHNVFHVQVKGSEQVNDGKSAKLLSDGEVFSVSLKISTLNYYLRIDSPVLLAFADLTVNPDPRKCPVYFAWIHEEIETLRGSNDNLDFLDQDTHTFHVPVSNMLTIETDFSDYFSYRYEKKYR